MIGQDLGNDCHGEIAEIIHRRNSSNRYSNQYVETIKRTSVLTSWLEGAV